MFFELRSYLVHLLRANGPHGVHSPLVFELLTQGLSKSRKYYSFDLIESERIQFLHNHNTIEVNDLGAGSRRMKSSSRKISDIAKTSLQPKEQAQALFRMIQFFNTTTIVELGTSLGITTAYLASSKQDAKVITIEGAESVAKEASGLFERLKLSNVELIVGNFDDQLINVLKRLRRVDFVLIDGNHQYESTMNYFNDIQSFIHETSVVVLDDIHWSADMNRAWNEIRQNSKVTLSIDFFHFGVVLFLTGREKEHFRLRLP